MYPGFLAAILRSSKVRQAFTLPCDPVRVDVTAREIRKTKTGYLSDATQPARIGQIEDAERTAEYRDVLQQEADLIAGHGVQRYIGLIAISARPRTRWTPRSPRSNTLQSKPRVRSAAW